MSKSRISDSLRARIVAAGALRRAIPTDAELAAEAGVSVRAVQLIIYFSILRNPEVSPLSACATLWPGDLNATARERRAAERVYRAVHEIEAGETQVSEA